MNLSRNSENGFPDDLKKSPYSRRIPSTRFVELRPFAHKNHAAVGSLDRVAFAPPYHLNAGGIPSTPPCG